jgi:long-chain acyl-CoA synthetase
MEDRPWFKSYEPQVPHTLTYPDVTLDTFLADAAQKYPFNTATNFVIWYVGGFGL